MTVTRISFSKDTYNREKPRFFKRYKMLCKNVISTHKNWNSSVAHAASERRKWSVADKCL